MADTTSVELITTSAKLAAAGTTAPPLDPTMPRPDAQPSAPQSREQWHPSRRFYSAMFALALLTLMVALDGTSLAVAIPTISHRLHGSSTEAFWAGTSFLLASTVIQPSVALWSHIFGRMVTIVGSVVVFFVGVVVAGKAGEMGMLLAGRTVQGIGGGGVLTLTEVSSGDGDGWAGYRLEGKRCYRH